MNNNIAEVLQDDAEEITQVDVGKRKKKRGLAANLVGKPSQLSTTSDSAQPRPELLKSAEQTITKVNGDIPSIKAEALPKLLPDKQTPVLEKSSSRNSLSTFSAADNNNNNKETTQLLVNDANLPSKIVSSDGSPRPATRSKLLGESKLAATAPPGSLTVGTASQSSTGETSKKPHTPRPLPAHLKQAFSSNSPRSSLNLTASLTEELTKSISTLTGVGADSLSNNNNSSTQPASFMRRVLSKDVRSRSYLVGCLGSQLSLGGKPELEYYFPDRLLRIYAGTFNMGAAKALPNDLESFVLPDYAASEYSSIAPHIFVFGTQESTSDRKRWLLKLQEILGQHFVCFCAPSFGSLGMAIFIRRELIWYVSAPAEATAWPKPFQPIATKGSLAISFELFGTSFLFINSHFSAGEGNLEARIEDYRRAIVELRFQMNPEKSAANQPQQQNRPFSTIPGSGLADAILHRRVASASGPPPPAPAGAKRPISADEANPSTPRDLNSSRPLDVTSQYDCVFWMGDFNFRVLRARQQVDKLIEGIQAAKRNQVVPAPANAVDQMLNPVATTNSHEVLLEHDEMSIEMAHGRLFTNFHEGRIRFMPSYKFDVGSNNYDTSLKLRIQSYTDRIIFRSRRKNAITCLAYSSVESVMTSDHKPIYGVYDVELRPGLDAIPTGAGCFDRTLYLEGLKQRTQPMLNDKSSAVCSIQ